LLEYPSNLIYLYTGGITIFKSLVISMARSPNSKQKTPFYSKIKISRNLGLAAL
jgi:hypothetical protein